jgi:arsenate reductase/ArsR family transcriptional regulator
MSLRPYEDAMKAVGDPTRVRILKILERGELCVCQVIAVIGLGQSTISKHLFLLRAAGLVRDRRDRKWIHYSLDGKGGNPYAGTLLRNIRKWLNDDPLILDDRERAATARLIGPVAICERGMALPGRGTARRRPADRGNAAAARSGPTGKASRS